MWSIVVGNYVGNFENPEFRTVGVYTGFETEESAQMYIEKNLSGFICFVCPQYDA